MSETVEYLIAIWYNNRPSYYHTKHWKTLRKIVLKRDKYKCVLCSFANNLQIHHRVYEPGQEQLSDLYTLCDTCHELFSFSNIQRRIETNTNYSLTLIENMWPIILTEDGFYRKGPYADIIGAA